MKIKQRSSNGFAQIFILIGIIVILAGAGYFVFQSKKSSQAPPEYPSNTQDSVAPQVEQYPQFSPNQPPALLEPDITLFLVSQEKVVKEKELDFENDGKKEIALFTQTQGSGKAGPTPNIFDGHIKIIAFDTSTQTWKISFSRDFETSGGNFALSEVADLNHDNKKEILYVYLVDGTGGFRDWGLIAKVNGKIQKVSIVPSSVRQPTGPRGSGHNAITLEGNFIKETYPVYLSNDPNCCPRGGTDALYYQFTGTGLRLAKYEYERYKDQTGFLTYSNFYGFNFRYPSDYTPWEAIDSQNEKLIPAGSKSEFVAVTQTESQLFCCEPSSLIIEVVQEKADPRDWLNRNLQKFTTPTEVKSIQNTTFAGRAAVEMRGGANIGSKDRVIVTTGPVPGRDYLIVITQSLPSQLFDNILSSFQFDTYR